MKFPFKLAFCISALLLLPAVAAPAASEKDRDTNLAAAPEVCGTNASGEYSESLARCENSRRSAASIERCRQKAKRRYDAATETCVAMRKAGGPQMDVFLPPSDPPKEPPPKDPPPQNPPPK